LLFYLAAYACMNVGAFAVLVALGRRGEPNEELDDLAGVGFRQPLLGFAMLVFMLSLAGVPPTVGFAGKFYLFSSAVASGWTWLAVFGVLNSLISVWYYLGVIVQMYMVEGSVQPLSPYARPCQLATIALTVVATVALGLFPGTSMQLAADAFASLR
jgi:NADH-quinone oxidoreductase subunit N